MAKYRWLLITLVCATLMAGNCLWLAQSHACCSHQAQETAAAPCHTPDNSRQSSPSICCVAQPAVTSLSALGWGTWQPDDDAAPAIHWPGPALLAMAARQETAMRAEEFVKNQQNRHLELCVLLN